MTNLFRKYKLYKLGICPDDKDLNMFEFIDSKISNLQTFKMEEYRGLLFFMNTDGENIIQFDARKNCLYAKYSGFCKILQSEYRLENPEIEIFIRSLVDNYVKIDKDPTFYDGLAATDIGVEYAFKKYLKNRLSNP